MLDEADGIEEQDTVSEENRSVGDYGQLCEDVHQAKAPFYVTGQVFRNLKMVENKNKKGALRF